MSVPVRRAQSHKRRHKHHAARIRNAGRQSLHVRGRPNQLQVIAQPLNHRPADKNAPLKRIFQALLGARRYRRNQPVPRPHKLVAHVLQQKASRPIGVLGLTCAPAQLPKQRRLLIPAIPAIAAPPRPSVVVTSPTISLDQQTFGSMLAGIPKILSSSSSHSPFTMLKSSVRDALVTSVTCRVPLVRCQISQLSTVPNASSPRSARARAPGTLFRIHPTLAGIEEELRLAYVAMTRARDYLCVLWPLRFYTHPAGNSDRHVYSQCSRFFSKDVREPMELLTWARSQRKTHPTYPGRLLIFATR